MGSKVTDGDLKARGERSVSIRQRDGVLFHFLYMCKFCTGPQAHRVAYDEYTEKGYQNRLAALEKAGYIGIYWKNLPPGAKVEFDFQGFGQPNDKTKIGLPERNTGGRVKDQYTRIIYLREKGEEYLRHSLGAKYRKAEPIVLNPNDNWSHQLAVSRIFVDLLEDERSIPKRLTSLLSDWDWRTEYRGYTVSGTKLSNLTGNLTPDSVVTHPDRTERLFIEYDRGTKVLGKNRNNPKNRNSIAATFEGYLRFFSLHYVKSFGDERPPLVVFVVRDAVRKDEIRAYAGLHFPELPLRVLVAESEIWHWFQDWMTERDKGNAPTVIRTDPELAVSEHIAALEKAYAEVKQELNQAIGVLAILRKNELPFTLPPRLETLVKIKNKEST